MSARRISARADGARPLPALLLAASLAAGCGRGADGKARGLAPAATGGLVVLDATGDRPTFFDFGTVAFGARPEHVFRLRNDEGSTVTIQDLLPSCGCAAPRISYVGADGALVRGDPAGRGKVLSLPSGAVADLAIGIDTERIERMNVDKLAQVRIRSDSAATPYLTFELHVVVARAMLSVPPAIDLGQTPQSAGKSGRADVAADDLRTRYRILGIESIEGPFTATLDETEVAGVPTWIVVASAKPGLPLGPVSGRVVLSVSGEGGEGKSPPFRIPLSAQILPDVVLRPPVLLFGAIERAKGAEVGGELVALVPGERVRVARTQVSATPAEVAAAITAEAEPIEPGEDGRAASWRVRLRASESIAATAFSGTLVLELDHPRVPEIRVPFSGTAR